MSDDLRRTPFEAANALPVGTRLSEFEVRRVLGIGGFGIVYLAFDHALEREVAVKEYMPASMAGRTQTMHVSLRSQSDADVFALGLRSFVNEAKLLARFDHPSLLKVFRFWEANGTAYMAMPVLRGRTLKDIRQDRPSLENPIDERWLRGLLDPLLGALDKLHSEAVYHRDIAPDNIVIEPDGHPVLLDFGAARRVISDRTQTLTAILKPAYAPIEQYAESGSVKQGPWTDLYALGATLHYMLLGQAPAPATARAVNDDHEPPLASRRIDGCSEAFLAAVDWMLAPRPGDRPQSVAALRAVLDGRAPLPRRPAPAPAPAATPTPWEPTAALPRTSAPAAASPTPNPPLSSAPAVASGPPAGQDPTVLVPPSRPPARAEANSPSPAAPPSQVAQVAPVSSASHHASGASEGRAAAGWTPPSGPAAAPAGRGKALLIGLGVAALAAVAAIALWPRAADGPSGQAPSITAPPAVTRAAPSDAAPVAASDAAPVTTSALPRSTIDEAAPALPATARPPASAPTATAGPPATPAEKLPASRSGPMPATAGAAAPRPAGPGAAGTPRPAESDSRAPAAAPGPAPATPPAERSRTTAAPAAPEAAAASTSTAAKPNGPEARCSGRNAALYFACMERECYRSRFRQHPECLEWHKNARQRDLSGN